LLFENQVNFVNLSLLEGAQAKIAQQKKDKKKKKKRAKREDSPEESSDSEIDEQAIREAEMRLTPAERKRIEMQHARESLPMFTFKEDLLEAIRDN